MRPAPRRDALPDLGLEHVERLAQVLREHAPLPAGVDPADGPRAVAARRHPDREDLVHLGGGAGPPSRREMRSEPLEQGGVVEAHTDAQPVGVEAGPRQPGQAVDSTTRDRAAPQSGHHARQAPHRAMSLPRRPQCSRRRHRAQAHDSCRRPGAAPAAPLYTGFSRLKRYLHLFSSSVTLAFDCHTLRAACDRSTSRAISACLVSGQAGGTWPGGDGDARACLPGFERQWLAEAGARSLLCPDPARSHVREGPGECCECERHELRPERGLRS